MTTTVRSVRVILDAAVAGYIRDMKLAGNETERSFSGIERRLADMDKKMAAVTKTVQGTATQAKGLRNELGGVSTGLDKVDRSVRRSDASIDKYSGRLKTILGLVQVLGPAALRLGLGSLPAISAGIAGLGAAGGGIGVTVAALSGMGDALDALDDWQAEPTVENLQKLRIEQARLGASGTQFLAYLDDLEPELRDLQMVARDGIFPGWEAGIDDLLTRLPMVRQIVNRLSQEVGLLGADAGEALASDKWTPFFEYVRATAAPTLDDFARSTGNVALGLANILVAFDPLTRSFTGGLEDMTARFARWSQGLEDDEGFQDFLDGVREAGPEVLDFLGSGVDLMVGLARASAPVGKIVLPALTATADAFAAIANSPIGPVIYTAATAWLIYSRAARLAQTATTGIQTQWAGMSRGGKAGAAAAGIGLVASAFTDVDEKAGLANTTMLGLTGLLVGGPLGAAAGVTAGLILDISHANDSLAESTQRANEAMQSGDTSQMRDQLEQLRDEIEETDKASSLEQGGLRGLGPGDIIPKLGALWSDYSGETDEAREAEAALVGQINATRSGLEALRPVLGGTADELIDAAQGAERLSQALAVLNGWFEKRDAMRGYKDAIQSIAQGLKDGFSREDVGNIDAAGQSILQVANLIQNPERRAGFLAAAREQLLDLAENSGPRAAAAIQKVVDKFDSEGLTNPPPIKLTADDKAAEAAFVRTRRSMSALDRTTATPTVQVNPGNSFTLLGGIQSALSRIVSKTITITVNKVGAALGGFDFADGGYTGDGAKHEPAGVVHRGEFVVDADRTRRDRGMLESRYGRLPGYATGGLVASTYTSRHAPTTTAGDDAAPPLHETAKAADRVAGSLKRLESRLDKVTTSYEKEKSKLDDLISSRSSLASSIASSYQNDPFGNGLAGFDAQIDADTSDLDAMATALATLVKNGLSPKSALYQRLAAEADVNTAQQLAQLSSGDLAVRAQKFEALGDRAQVFGEGIAGPMFNEAIREQTKETRELHQQIRRLNDRIDDLKDLPKHVGEATYQMGYEGTRKGSNEGTRAGVRDRDVATTAMVRTGGGRRR